MSNVEIAILGLASAILVFLAALLTFLSALGDALLNELKRSVASANLRLSLKSKTHPHNGIAAAVPLYKAMGSPLLLLSAI